MPDSRWTDDQIQEMLQHMADGIPIVHIEKMPGMPSADSMERWEAAGDPLAGSITRARARGWDKRAADAVVTAKAAEDPSKGRLAFDAERWFLSKLAPRKYGDKTLLGSDPENPLPTAVSLDMSKLSEAALREIEAAGKAKE